MNALPMPSSSATSDLPDSAWRAAKSPITFALFSAALRSESARATGSWDRAGAGAGTARVLAVADMKMALLGGVGWFGVQLSYGWRESYRPGRVDPAQDAAGMPQMIEMGDRLAHREVALLDVELAAEEDGDEVGGAQGCRGGAKRVLELGEPRI